MHSLSALVLTLLAPAAINAHLFISSPAPIPGSAPKDPLAGDGSNFPCHGVRLPGAGGAVMPAGSNQLLAFDDGGGFNTAVHGGGSCQISITYETEPAKIRRPENWFVILSVEGGCPTNSLANLDGGYSGPSGTYSGSRQCNDTSTNGFDCLNQFQFNIPSGMKSGPATLAWTWFNNIGNREIYMNCAAIQITGGASTTSQMQNMPGLFVANLRAADLPSTCASSERSNVGFPNPGPVLLRRQPSSRVFVASATSQYPIRTPGSCPNNARTGAIATTTPTSTDDPLPITSSTPQSLTTSSTTGTSTTTRVSSSVTDLSSSVAASGSNSVVSSSSSSSGVSSASESTSAADPTQTTTRIITTRTTTTRKTTTRKTTTRKTTTRKTTTTKKTTTKKSTTRRTTTSRTTVVPSISIIPSTTIITTRSDTPSTPTSSLGAAPSNTCPSGSVPCSTFNDVVCPDTSHYGICDFNMCAVSQAVAPGTACVDGQIVGALSRRSAASLHLARHARRRV